MKGDIGNDVPLLVAARVGAPSYVRLLLQARARPPGPEGSYGSILTDNVLAIEDTDADQFQASSYALLAHVTAAFGQRSPEGPTPTE